MHGCAIPVKASESIKLAEDLRKGKMGLITIKGVFHPLVRQQRKA